jgi:hypothetical protein
MTDIVERAAFALLNEATSGVRSETSPSLDVFLPRARAAHLAALDPTDELTVKRVSHAVFESRYGETPDDKAGAWKAAGHHYIDDARAAIVALATLAQGVPNE